MGYLDNLTTRKPINFEMLIAETKRMPLLFYGVEVFGNSDATGQHKLLVAFGNVERYIFNRKGTDRISDATLKVLDLPLKERSSTKHYYCCTR